MAHKVVEFIKVNGSFVPIEFRFIRCKIVFDDREQETTHWMNPTLWKELIEAVRSLLIVKASELAKETPSSEPNIVTTSKLKLAYIFKSNEFRGQRLLEPINNNNKGSRSFTYHDTSKRMVVMSVSLNRAEMEFQDLYTALPQSQMDRQLKISSYFTSSLPDE